MKITKTQLKQIIKEELETTLNEEYVPSSPKFALDRDPSMYYFDMKNETDDALDEESQILNAIATTMKNTGLTAIDYKRQWPRLIERAKERLSKYENHPEAQKALKLLDALLDDDNRPLNPTARGVYRR